MPCFHPRVAWQAPGGGRVSFTARPGLVPMQFPCQSCIGCRMMKRLSWVVRCLLEHRLHSVALFLTLTYDGLHLPLCGSVSVRDRQLFFKRLREYLAPLGVQVRYYGCDEYGPQTMRPHYHVILFGWWPSDAKLHSSESQMWTSAELTRLWGNGFASFGLVTRESIAYVASHNVDKLTGEAARKRYERVDLETGEVYELEPERAFMSRRPGIGAGFLDKYLCDVANVEVDGLRLAGGQVVPLGTYIDRKIEEVLPELAASRKAKRKADAQLPERQADSTDARLRVREFVATANVSRQRERRKL